jgi:aspartate-semialdehyde dehydrogenase
VPLVVPEVNPEHLELLAEQRRLRGWTGGIVCNPNCTATVLVMALAPLQRRFGVEAVMMSSMQAISGAGYPGVASLDITANVIPYIPSEETKVEEEVPRMLGVSDGIRVTPAAMAVSASCHRVAVVDGHTEAVSVQLKGTPSLALVRAAFLTWSPEPQRLKLPSAPPLPIRIHDEPERPQPRLDVERDGGMSVHVGRLRPCAILGIKFALLGHNTQRGAAGGSVLNAELAHARGLLA